MKDIAKRYIIVLLSFIIIIMCLFNNKVAATEEQLNDLYLLNLKVIAVTKSGEKILEPTQEYNEQSLEREYYGTKDIEDIKIEYKIKDKSALVEVKKPETYSNEINIVEIKIVRNEEFVVYQLFIKNNSEVVEVTENQEEQLQEIEQQEEKKDNQFIIIMGNILEKVVIVLIEIKEFLFKHWIKILVVIILLIIIITIKNKIQEKKALKARKELKDRCR